MKTIISCDPGANGAIAWRDADGVINAKAMPDTRGDVIALIKQIVFGRLYESMINKDIVGTLTLDVVAYHEKISGYIPDGGPSMMFQFGANCERVSCILETLGVRIIEVTPRAWQKSLGLGKKGLTKAPEKATKEEKAAVKTTNAAAKRDWKNKLKSEAQRRFPNAPVTLRTCDALLILDYAIAQEGQPKTVEMELI